MYDVVALGELLIDFACISQDSEGYPTMAAHPGGAPANFLAAVTKFGGKTALIAKLGNDSFGKRLTDTLLRSGIDTKGLVYSDEVFTTLAFVSFDACGEREFSFARKPGADTRLCFDEIDLSLIDEARVFHFGTLSLTDEPAREATRRAVEYAKTRGKLISFDPNLRKPLWKSLDDAKAQMLWGLENADIVKISNDEVEFLFGLVPEEAARHILDSFSAKLVYISCGAEGCVYANANTLGFVPALRGLHVIDTCGAGDIFGGSAMWKLMQTGTSPESLSDEQLKDIVGFACAAAGLSTEKSGGISSIPNIADVLQKL